MVRKVQVVSRSTLFEELDSVSKNYGETNDCAVKAISLVTGVDYGTVLSLCTKYGRKKGCGTHTQIIMRVISDLGFSFSRYELSDLIRNYPTTKQNKVFPTLYQAQRFPQAWAKLPSNIMMFTGSHVSSWVDGRLHDWAEGRSKQIYMMWVIYKKGL